jgi:hypothetical protein
MAFNNDIPLRDAELTVLKAQRAELSSGLPNQMLALQMMSNSTESSLAAAIAQRKRVEAELAEAQAAVATLMRSLADAAGDEAEQHEKMEDVAEVREELEKISTAIGEIDAELSRRAELRKGQRNFAKLHLALPYGTSLSLSSRGVTWALRYTERGFEREDIVFKSPTAVTTAHARLVHEGHPAETHPGNGWVWLKVAEGEHEGKSIANVYDAYFGF